MEGMRWISPYFWCVRAWNEWVSRGSCLYRGVLAWLQLAWRQALAPTGVTPGFSASNGPYLVPDSVLVWARLTQGNTWECNKIVSRITYYLTSYKIVSRITYSVTYLLSHATTGPPRWPLQMLCRERETIRRVYATWWTLVSCRGLWRHVLWGVNRSVS